MLRVPSAARTAFDLAFREERSRELVRHREILMRLERLDDRGERGVEVLVGSVGQGARSSTDGRAPRVIGSPSMLIEERAELRRALTIAASECDLGGVAVDSVHARLELPHAFGECDRGRQVLVRRLQIAE
jgi:hypothetical protein